MDTVILRIVMVASILFAGTRSGTCVLGLMLCIGHPWWFVYSDMHFLNIDSYAGLMAQDTMM